MASGSCGRPSRSAWRASITGAACGGSPPNSGQNSWNEQYAHSADVRGRKSSRAHAVRTAFITAPDFTSTPRSDWSVGAVMIRSGFER